MSAPDNKWSASLKDLRVGSVNSHFFDSGSFSLMTRAKAYAAAGNGPYAYYDTREFWDYLDAYAAFIKKHGVGIDLYANVDVIPDPELTLRNQAYLEREHNLHPVPVVHYRTSVRWLQLYIEAGYKIIGLGGLVGSSSTEHCQGWLDDCFRMVCDTYNGLPQVKIHGFGVTVYDLMRRYPWWSLDSTSWAQVGGFGGILVPHYRRGKFVFTEQPYLVKVSVDSPDRRKKAHALNLPAAEKKILDVWLERIGIPLGKAAKDGTVLGWGVMTRHSERQAANLLFFEELRKSLPEYPWPFRSTRRKRLGLFEGA